MNTDCSRALSVLSVTGAFSLSACGGGSAAPIVPISVTVSSPSSIAQAGTSVSLQVTVANSANQQVTFGLSPSAGTVSPSGVYSAPTTVDATKDVTITATSVADSTKSGSAKITIVAAPSIAVRRINGLPRFITTRDGAVFIPRGNNYLHFNASMIRVQNGSVGYGRSTINATLYDPQKVDQAMAAMAASQYNVVRTFLDILDVGDIGNDAGTGLSSIYAGNLADFMTRAKAHQLFVIPIFEQLPMAGGYRKFITGSLQSAFGTFNIQFLTQPGIDATQQFWRDLISGLVAAHAPMDALFAYDLTGEFYIDNSSPPMAQASGTIETANGSSYDMSNQSARIAVQNDNMVYYANKMVDAIHSLNPGALTVIGFFTYNGTNPPPFPAITTANTDFIDLHGWPDKAGTTVQQLVSAWHV